MDVLEQLHTDVADAIHAVEAGLATLKDKYRELAAHLGAEIPPLQHEAEAAGKEFAAAAVGDVESAVTQTVVPPSTATTATPVADVTTPPIAPGA